MKQLMIYLKNVVEEKIKEIIEVKPLFPPGELQVPSLETPSEGVGDRVAAPGRDQRVVL